MIYKVGLLGASGRMGQELAALLAEGFTLGADAFEFADGITQSGRLVSLEGVELRTLNEPAREPVHVWIDFSRPEATLELLTAIHCPVVIGTTGFTPVQREAIEAFARKFPVLVAPNTSAGISVLLRMVRSAKPLHALGFQAELSDDHHKRKVDAPSGTAKSLLKQLADIGFTEVPVHVTRAGTTVGTHSVRLIGDGEELRIEHRVTDRRIFCRGALWGAQFLLKQKTPRVYQFEEVAFDGEEK